MADQENPPAPKSKPYGGGGNNNRRNQQPRNRSQAKFVGIDENNPILMAFKKYSEELDDKHDRYERLVKLSRDITIESKRIIFTLHSIDVNDEEKKEIVLKEVEERLLKVCATLFASIAEELQGMDTYQYARSYSAGLQEFIEALTFWEYISGKPISDWSQLQKKLTYEQKIDEETNLEVAPKTYQCLVQPIEFMLGLADLSGEVMRKCVNSLTTGNINICFESCKFLQDLYSGYLTMNTNRVKDMNFKIFTMKQSVIKCETVCYNVKVRGKEAAKWGSMSGDFKKTTNDDEDEGFF